MAPCFWRFLFFTDSSRTISIALIVYAQAVPKS
jgi:hypothetical protein